MVDFLGGDYLWRTLSHGDVMGPSQRTTGRYLHVKVRVVVVLIANRTVR